MIRYSYNTQKQPPAPFVLITLQNPVTGTEVRDVPAKLDTAADRSLVPLSIAHNLSLNTSGSVAIGGVGGTIEYMTLYAVRVGIHNLPTQLIEVVAHPNEPWMLLGRDLLNAYRVVLDGPQLALEIG